MGGSGAPEQGPCRAQGTFVAALALPCVARIPAWFHNAACERKVFLTSVRREQLV